jgi:hypothetical protein
MKNFLSTLLVAVLICTFFSCSGDKETENKETKNTTETPTTEVPEKPQVKGPIINIQDSLEVKQTVLCLKDSSATIEGMYQKLSNIYNVLLQETITKGKLAVMGSPMAWQTMEKDAYFFEAGIPVDKAPAKMGKGMYMKNTDEDSTVVAHFWGMPSQKNTAYTALEERLTDMAKTKSSAIYEVYRGNIFPANNEVVDYYKQQTDIIVPIKKTIIPKEKPVKLTLTAREQKEQMGSLKKGKGVKKAKAAPKK